MLYITPDEAKVVAALKGAAPIEKVVPALDRLFEYSRDLETRQAELIQQNGRLEKSVEDLRSQIRKHECRGVIA